MKIPIGYYHDNKNRMRKMRRNIKQTSGTNLEKIITYELRVNEAEILVKYTTISKNIFFTI